MTKGAEGSPEPAAKRGPPGLARATYRLQLNAEFPFEAARGVVPYLADLGISHVYASPVMASRPGSTHGYDIVDHTRIEPEIGGRDGLDAFVRELHRHGMGLILDFVPNHMGIGADNEWWMDVLEWGRASPRAGYFDIDWDPPGPGLDGRVLLPVLGDHYGSVLERGELEVRFDPERGGFAVHYFDNRFPIAPRDQPPILRRAAERAAAEGGEGADRLQSLAERLDEMLRARPAKARRNAVEEWRKRFVSDVREEVGLRRAIEAEVSELNGRPEDPSSVDRLDRILERQSYRLAFWRVAAFEINYRRFFDIDDLAGIRMEDPELFETGHSLVRSLLVDGSIQGLRLDHVDGLRDPKSYFDRLRALWPRGDGNSGEDAPSPWILVEKILAGHEALRADWAVQGTTGYEFMAGVNGLFVDPSGERPLARAYDRFTGGRPAFDETVIGAKRLIMRETLASELNVLANLFHRLARQSRITRDFTLTGFRAALADVVAQFRVYRTYVRPRDGPSAADRIEIEMAVGTARRKTRQADASIYDFVQDVLTLDLLKVRGRGYRRRDVVDAALRFQQYTGPVMAKSFEDTAFYRDFLLVALNEVGSEPDRFGVSPTSFHRGNARRLAEHPFSLITTATHDHKRGEDVRARLDVLSEVPREWGRRVRHWSRLNRRRRQSVEGRPVPTPNDEYLLYQTLVGAWPYGLDPVDGGGLTGLRGRIEDYMLKAVREGKERTSWVAPDEEYEAALVRFAERVLDPDNQAFLIDLRAFVADIAPTGAVNGLAQTLIKLTSPGVPDTYQGTELWDLSLVDPDNRRPVDYDQRARALEDDASWHELLDRWQDGHVKQRLMHRTLALRRSHPWLFAEGEYHPVGADGRHAERVVAFARTRAGTMHDQTSHGGKPGGASAQGGTRLLVVAPRLVHPLMEGVSRPLPEGWGDTRLRLGEAWGGLRLENRLGGGKLLLDGEGALPVGEILRKLPVALFLAEDAGSG